MTAPAAHHTTVWQRRPPLKEHDSPSALVATPYDATHTRAYKHAHACTHIHAYKHPHTNSCIHKPNQTETKSSIAALSATTQISRHARTDGHTRGGKAHTVDSMASTQKSQEHPQTQNRD